MINFFFNNWWVLKTGKECTKTRTYLVHSWGDGFIEYIQVTLHKLRQKQQLPTENEMKIFQAHHQKCWASLGNYFRSNWPQDYQRTNISFLYPFHILVFIILISQLFSIIPILIHQEYSAFVILLSLTSIPSFPNVMTTQISPDSSIVYSDYIFWRIFFRQWCWWFWWWWWWWWWWW